MSTLPRQIVIGDVHGHYDTLVRLLDSLDLKDGDRVDFLGDLIDRGPASYQVVDLIMSHPSYYAIRGNHEEMMLSALVYGQHDDRYFDFWLSGGGDLTLESYPNSGVMYEHLDWLESLPAYRDRGDVWLVHAGVNPHLPIAEQSTQEFCWIRDLFHRQTQPYFPDKLIIIGHTITFTFPGVQSGQLVRGCGWLGIDTGVYTLESGWLTAVDVTEQRVYQANVWQESLRSLPWDDIIISLDPNKVRRRRFALK
ncbi:serine/threonine protein phosphatase [Phormidium willei BDU 130791]|nr:serine/threonine protein phosphatase [Phormidium willei BDU 130791]